MSDTKRYYWRGKHPLHMPKGDPVQPGDSFVASEAVYTAFQDLMEPYGGTLVVAVPRDEEEPPVNGVRAPGRPRREAIRQEPPEESVHH